MNAPEDLSLRIMGRDDLGVVLGWAQEEGWNPGTHDTECFHATDPGGFLLGERNGEPVSSISIVQYPGDFAFLGFYIVRPELRGRGYGRKTWRAGLRRVTGSVIGLDGVAAQQANYRKSGFALAWRNIRYRGRPVAPGRPDPRAGQIVPLSTIPMPVLEAYDRRFFPAPRPAFLRLWISRPGTMAMGIKRATGLAGYGVIRPCYEGFKIGPLFADDAGAAEALFAKLAEQAGNGPLYIDPPEFNRPAIRLAEAAGLRPVFETARMYLGPAPSLDRAGMFGITSFELG